MKDRVVQYPNRYKLTPVSGTSDTYDFEAAPGTVTEPGDDINKANFLPDTVKALLNLTQTNPQIADALTKLSGAALRATTKPLSAVTVGSEFYLYENSVLVPFIKLKTNYEGSGRTLVIRKNAIASMAWNSAGNNAYSGSTIDTYLNTTYIGYLDSSTQAVLANVNIPYTIGNGNTTVTTLPRKSFALSLTEYGLSGDNRNIEGTAIALFNSDASRIVTYNGSAVSHMIRTPATGVTNAVGVITSAGQASALTVTNTAYARPAFTLPETFETPLQNNTITDMSGNEFALPYSKVVTGSYTGTGTYGSGNPTTLTASFNIKFALVWEIDSFGSFLFMRAVNGQTSAKMNWDSSTVVTETLSWGATSFSWYNSSNSGYQLNGNGSNYRYLLLG